MSDEQKPQEPRSSDPGRPAESSRRGAYATLREFFDSIPNIVFSLDPEYRILDVNHVIPGATREQIIGQVADSFVIAEEREHVRAHWHRALTTGETLVYETTGHAAAGMDGSDIGRMHFMSTVGPLYRGGQVIGVVVSTMDITARKRLEQTTREAIERAEGAVAELAEKNRELEQEMVERAQAERLLTEQREALRALSTPILKLWDGVVALPVIGVVDSARAAQMMDRLLQEIARSGARVSILDLTGVDFIDTSTASHLLNLVRAAALLGSQCLISGISPTVAQTMIHLDIGIEALRTFGSLEDALRHAIGGAAQTPEKHLSGGQSPERRPGSGREGDSRPPSAREGDSRPPSAQDSDRRPPGAQDSDRRPLGGPQGDRRPPSAWEGDRRPPSGPQAERRLPSGQVDRRSPGGAKNR